MWENHNGVWFSSHTPDILLSLLPAFLLLLNLQSHCPPSPHMWSSLSCAAKVLLETQPAWPHHVTEFLFCALQVSISQGPEQHPHRHQGIPIPQPGSSSSHCPSQAAASAASWICLQSELHSSSLLYSEEWRKKPYTTVRVLVFSHCLIFSWWAISH